LAPNSSPLASMKATICGVGDRARRVDSTGRLTAAISNSSAVVKLGRIVPAGATAGELGDGDNVLRIRSTRLTYEIRRPVRQ
jgi:hypothetical protein